MTTYDTSTDVETGFRDVLRDNLTDLKKNRKPGEQWIFAGRPKPSSTPNFPYIYFDQYSGVPKDNISGTTGMKDIYYQINVFALSRGEVRKIFDEFETKLFLDNFTPIVIPLNDFIRDEPHPSEGVIYHGIYDVMVQWSYTRGDSP